MMPSASAVQTKGRGFSFASAKLALTACMRKLIVTLNAMLRTNTAWKPGLTPNTVVLEHKGNVGCRRWGDQRGGQGLSYA